MVNENLRTDSIIQKVHDILKADPETWTLTHIWTQSIHQKVGRINEVNRLK